MGMEMGMKMGRAVSDVEALAATACNVEYPEFFENRLGRYPDMEIDFERHRRRSVEYPASANRISISNGGPYPKRK
ncbi:hypothetical protein V1477_004792 [Vespula maculifrons]|uniref:Uncharacterized protein n=2 Tax=Vespula TaxID=7451 RepID=A0A834NMZ3_VESGE|nr:hypothetical protein HZH68_002840 [Vespula germanica]